MKFVKGFSLYVIYPLLLLGLGFCAGVELERFFYPGRSGLLGVQGQNNLTSPLQGLMDFTANTEADTSEITMPSGDLDITDTAEVFEVSSRSETLSVDTEYVLEETDTITHEVVETIGKLPHKYIGMDREQFMVALESYEAYPPLSEKERGFVGLEVLAFSRERVVIQMNYRYLQPGSSFYLAVKDNELVVYLEDQETIYINTGILLEELPEEVQMQVMQMLEMEDEASLYNFLEAYTS